MFVPPIIGERMEDLHRATLDLDIHNKPGLPDNYEQLPAVVTGTIDPVPIMNTCLF